MSTDHLLHAVFLFAAITLILSFPLRPVGRKKNILPIMIESRNPILCWIVQVDTLKTCECADRANDHNYTEQEKYSKEFKKSSSCCIGHSNIQEHLIAISTELELEIQHSFGAFHDHFLFCHNFSSQPVGQHERHDVKAKSQSLMKIHDEHSHLLSNNSAQFLRYKEEDESRLSEHEEIVWFTVEHIHWQKSRAISNEMRKQARQTFEGLTIEKLDLVHQSPEYQNISSLLNLKIANFQNKSHSSSRFDGSISLDSSKSFTEYPSRLHKRETTLHFNDPAFPKQWHLKNAAQKGMDINVTELWSLHYNGTGVTVAVVDDGVEWQNLDLNANYDYRGSWDLNDNDPDPSPSPAKTTNHHGTRCAGEIAAVANNGVCGVGVAYGAKFSGLRVLDGPMTDSMEAEAFNKKMDINDIYSCSWGPDDDGKTVDGPNLMASKAMKYGVDFGRQGYGNIFIVASGNGGEHMDNCNFDGYANSIYTLTIGAVDEMGMMPYYAEECASMLGVTFSSGTVSKRDIVTTDWKVGKATGCTDSHSGTSAAAPLAAGMIALMLQARYCLTWRDVQYIIILTSQKVDVDLAHWSENGAGLSHSHKHGFGLLSAWRLVNAARVWETVPWPTSYSRTDPSLGRTIPKGSPLNITYMVTNQDIQGLGLFTLENVQLTVWLTHPFRGKLEIQLISPANTSSVLAAPRPLDNSSSGFTDWTFTTVRCWGEQPQGNWTIIFIDHDDLKAYGHGTVTKLRLTLFGTPMTPHEFSERRRRVEAAMSGEYLQASQSLPCSPPQKYDESYAPVSEKVLKFLILAGAFCFLMGVYETFEYMFCYNDEKKETAANKRISQLELVQLGSASDILPSNGDTNHSNADSNVPSSSGMAVPGGANDDSDGDDDVFDISETASLISLGKPVSPSDR